jgi:hypothetical protein
MAIEISKENEKMILKVKVSDKLSKEDYDRFVPEAESLIEKNGKINVLFEMHDFHGWQIGALWEDIKFDAKHFSNIERLAFVGDKKWEKGMSIFCKPFTTAKIRYFEHNEINEAFKWLKQS